MELDIRQPIGWLFMLIGALLVAQGAIVATPERGLVAGLNLNIGWGAVMMLFGFAMLMLARRHARLHARDAARADRERRA
jgi:NADH:ubiquinone oxidoreductase subunit 6 (subunit J)